VKKIILVYHEIDTKDNFLSVDFMDFQNQMDYLQSKGFTFCFLEELLTDNNKRSVCIIFDDSYKSILMSLDFMRKRNLKCCIAVISSKVGQEQYLSLDDLKNYNCDLYYHTENHCDLTSINELQIESELDCDLEKYNYTLVYPMGKYNKKIIEIAKKKGFKYGLSLLPFHLSKKYNPYEIPRINVNGYLSIQKFKFFISKLGNVYLKLAFIKRKILRQSYLEK